MVDIVNFLFATLSIGLGLIGWFAPGWTMQTLDLRRGASTMGVSEVRAASGALFVGLGTGALFIGTPIAYAMVGFAWGFAALGRLTSILLDEAPIRRTWVFLVIEAIVGATLIGLNFTPLML